MFTVLAPIGVFFDAIALLGILRGVASWRTLEYGAIGLTLTGGAILMRPRVDKARAIRIVLVDLGILGGAAAAAVLVIVYLRDFVLGGTVYLAGWVVDAIVGGQLLKKASRSLTSRTETELAGAKPGDSA
jgi:hypothetical protein